MSDLYTPEEVALAETLQIFEDIHCFKIPASPQPPTQSNLMRAKDLIAKGYAHTSWRAA